MKMTPFVVLTVIGSVIWNTVADVARDPLRGHRGRSVLEILDSYMLAILVIAAALGVVIGIFAYREKADTGINGKGFL